MRDRRHDGLTLQTASMTLVAVAVIIAVGYSCCQRRSYQYMTIHYPTSRTPHIIDQTLGWYERALDEPLRADVLRGYDIHYGAPESGAVGNQIYVRGWDDDILRHELGHAILGKVRPAWDERQHHGFMRVHSLCFGGC